MNLLDSLFNTLVFTRLRVSDGYALYYAKLQSFLANGYRYVILAVQSHKASYEKAYCWQLPWVSLQTRTLKEDINIPEQVIDLKLLDHRYSKDKMQLKVRNRTQAQTEYFTIPKGDNLMTQPPLDVVLLHDPRKKSMYQYPDSLEIRQALSTFECVVKKI